MEMTKGISLIVFFLLFSVINCRKSNIVKRQSQTSGVDTEATGNTTETEGFVDVELEPNGEEIIETAQGEAHGSGLEKSSAKVKDLFINHKFENGDIISIDGEEEAISQGDGKGAANTILVAENNIPGDTQIVSSMANATHEGENSAQASIAAEKFASVYDKLIRHNVNLQGSATGSKVNSGGPTVEELYEQPQIVSVQNGVWKLVSENTANAVGSDRGETGEASAAADITEQTETFDNQTDNYKIEERGANAVVEAGGNLETNAVATGKTHRELTGDADIENLGASSYGTAKGDRGAELVHGASVYTAEESSDGTQKGGDQSAYAVLTGEVEDDGTSNDDDHVQLEGYSDISYNKSTGVNDGTLTNIAKAQGKSNVLGVKDNMETFDLNGETAIGSESVISTDSNKLGDNTDQSEIGHEMIVAGDGSLRSLVSGEVQMGISNSTGLAEHSYWSGINRTSDELDDIESAGHANTSATATGNQGNLQIVSNVDLSDKEPTKGETQVSIETSGADLSEAASQTQLKTKDKIRGEKELGAYAVASGIGQRTDATNDLNVVNDGTAEGQYKSSYAAAKGASDDGSGSSTSISAGTFRKRRNVRSFSLKPQVETFVRVCPTEERIKCILFKKYKNKGKFVYKKADVIDLLNSLHVQVKNIHLVGDKKGPSGKKPETKITKVHHDGQFGLRVESKF